MKLSRFAIPLIIAVAAPNCSTEEQVERRTVTPSPSPANKQDSGSKESNTADQQAANDNTKNDANLSLVTGEQYFDKTLKPLLDTNCASCHADPRNVKGVSAPLTIYSYQSMRKKLENGSSGINNDLINKAQGVINHGGGNRCGNAGVEATPCKEIVQWYTIEFKETEGTGLLGAIKGVDVMGKATGWAIDKDNASTNLEVTFYCDKSPDDQGTSCGKATANVDGFDGNSDGSHAFSFTLPDQFRDGKSHKLFAFVTDGTNNVALPGSPFAFTSYHQTQAGKQYYQQTVMPLVNTRCGGCHVVSYDQQYASLINPPPHLGGTASSNELLNYPSGSSNHPPGNVCGGKNGSPCREFQTWWQMEFAAQ